MFIIHLYIFFGERPIWILCQFKILSCLFIVEFQESFTYIICNYFLPFYRLSFIKVAFEAQIFFLSWWHSLYFLIIIACALSFTSKGVMAWFTKSFRTLKIRDIKKRMIYNFYPPLVKPQWLLVSLCCTFKEWLKLYFHSRPVVWGGHSCWAFGHCSNCLNWTFLTSLVGLVNGFLSETHQPSELGYLASQFLLT